MKGDTLEAVCYVDSVGALRVYRTGEYIRAATEREWHDSMAAAERDGGAGMITVTIDRKRAGDP